MSDESNAQLSLADELAIRNLLNKVALLADSDSDDLEAYGACWAEDGIWETPRSITRGRQAIQEGAAARRRDGLQGPRTNTCHVVTNQIVEFDGPDSASSQSYMLFLIDTVDVPKIRVLARYFDNLSRTDQGWKLAKRVVSFG